MPDNSRKTFYGHTINLEVYKSDQDELIAEFSIDGTVQPLKLASPGKMIDQLDLKHFAAHISDRIGLIIGQIGVQGIQREHNLIVSASPPGPPRGN